MARPKIPASKARTTGRTVHDPGRFRGRSAPASPALGAPSPWLTERQQEAFEALKVELPWLQEADRCVTELAAIVRARLWSGEVVGVTAINFLRQCMGQMGGTPADRTKIAASADDGGDPAEGYLQ